MTVYPENLFTIIIFTAIIPVAALWIRDVFRNVSKHWEPSEDKLVHCQSCQYTFLVKPRTQIAVCPACRENVRVRLRKFKHLRY